MVNIKDKNILQETMKDHKVDGKDIPYITKDAIYNFGIIKPSHNAELYNSIQSFMDRVDDAQDYDKPTFLNFMVCIRDYV